MTDTIYLAAGCFWGTQYYFDQIPGVLESTVGYMGGHVDNPTYEQVCYEDTGHTEAVKIVFDPAVVPLINLLEQFFYMHDPTQLNRQGLDTGSQYRSAIFYAYDEQERVVSEVITSSKSKFKDPIVTEVSKAGTFWPAEEYHQKYTERTGRGVCHVAYKDLTK